MLKKMNLPNKLTLLRIALVPFVIAAMLIEFPFHYTAAGLLFGAAALTDAFDGKIARQQNLITDFGKFADPLADKILVISALVCFVKAGLSGAVPLSLIIFREFAVTSIRLVAASRGKVIAANIWGKVKTVTQIVAIVSIFVMMTALDIISLVMISRTLPLSALSDCLTSNGDRALICQIYGIFNIISQVMMWIIALITIISGVIYLKDNREVIADM